MRSSTSCGMRFFSTSIAARTPAPVSTMFASCDFWMSIVIAGRPLMRAIESSSFSPSITSATCERYTGAPPCWATTMRPNCGGIANAPLHAHERVGLAVGDAPCRYVLVRGADRVDHLIDADRQAGERGRLHLHQDLARHAPVHVEARDPGHVLEALHDHLVGERRELAQAHRGRRHRDRYDRLRILGLRAHDQRVLHLARKLRTHQRNLVAQVLHRARHVGGKPELHEDLTLALERVRADELHAGHGIDRVLERLRHVRLDGIRRCARIGRDDHDERQIHFRHLLDPQALIREEAEHGQPDHHHRREHGIVDRNARDPHGGPPVVVAEEASESGAQPDFAEPGARTSAGAPSFRLSKREARTGAPAGRAVRTSTRPASSSRRPVTIVRRTSLPPSIVHT